MSEVAPLPRPPLDAENSGTSSFRYVALLVVMLLGMFVVLELRMLNSGLGKEALQRIRADARVRAEFGTDLHVPYAVAWGFFTQAQIYARLTGSRAHGHATVVISPLSGHWSISALEVHNDDEQHLINLAQPEIPARPEQLQGTGSLYFAALGDSASGDVADLASFFEKDLGIAVKVLPPMPLPAEGFDQTRKQWVAEMLVQAMAAHYPEIAADPGAKLIGIIEDDLYIRSYNWPFAYSYREAGKYSVIPTVRLDPSFDHFPPSAAIRIERLRKIAMKPVGLLYLGFGQSSNPQSVDGFEGSTEDIDRMGSVFLASDVRTRSASENTEGTPCLTFFRANVTGAPLHKPIMYCGQLDWEGEDTEYQIDLAQGRFQFARNDLLRGGPTPLVLQRMNFSHHFDDKVRAFGKNSWQNLDDTVWSVDPKSIQTISIYGTKFQRTTPGSGFSPAAQYRAERNVSDFSGALLSWENSGWRIDTQSGSVWRYLGCGPQTRVQCYFMSRTDAAGDGIEVKRDPDSGHIVQVMQKTNSNFPSAVAHDHVWTAVYDGEKIIEIDEGGSPAAHFRYDRDEYLTDVEADGHQSHYEYDDAHRITQAVEDGNKLQIHYDSEARADRVEFPNGSAWNIHYSGQAIEVDGPGGRYSVTVFPTYFKTVELK